MDAWESSFLHTVSKIDLKELVYTGFSPEKNLRHSGWAWFGRSSCPHQPLWLPHQRNMDIEGMEGHYAERAWGEH